MLKRSLQHFPISPILFHFLPDHMTSCSIHPWPVPLNPVCVKEIQRQIRRVLSAISAIVLTFSPDTIASYFRRVFHLIDLLFSWICWVVVCVLPWLLTMSYPLFLDFSAHGSHFTSSGVPQISLSSVYYSTHPVCLLRGLAWLYLKISNSRSRSFEIRPSASGRRRVSGLAGWGHRGCVHNKRKGVHIDSFRWKRYRRCDRFL